MLKVVLIVVGGFMVFTACTNAAVGNTGPDMNGSLIGFLVIGLGLIALGFFGILRSNAKDKAKERDEAARREEERRARQAALFDAPIIPDPQSRWQMKTLPDFASVAADAIARSGKVETTAADDPEIRGQVFQYVLGTLQQMFSKTGLNPQDVVIVMGRSDFDLPLLTDYLSTCGTAGPIVNDRLAELLSNDIPGELGVKIAHGLR